MATWIFTVISIITIEWYQIIFLLINLTKQLILTRKNVSHFHYVISTFEGFVVIIRCCKIILISWKMNSLSYVLLKPGRQTQIVILYGMSRYVFSEYHRNSRSGGGVGIYIKDCLDHTLREDLSVFNDDLEAVFVELPNATLNLNTNVIVGTIYRPPGSDLMNDLMNGYRT